MDAPSYVQGLYTVAQRDAIFTKANKYPDAANGLQNQVPTIFPDGSIGWRQIPEGGDGTANANIAVVEPTQYASKDYSVGDLLIYNGQLSRVSTPIAAGGTITPETNVVSTTVALWAPESFVPLVGKGVNLLDNAYFIGGGAAGAFPVNQRGVTNPTKSNEVAIDRWYLTGTLNCLSSGIQFSTGGNFIYQKIDTSLANFLNGKEVTVSILFADGTFATGTNTFVALPQSNQYYIADVKAQAVSVTYPFPNLMLFCVDPTAVIAAVKLELGNRQTLARQVNGAWVLNDPPPNYQQELAKCQRYLHIIKTDNAAGALIGSGYVNSGVSKKQIIITIYSPVTMNPITSIQTSGVGAISDGAIRALDAASIFAQAGNIITLDLTSNVDIPTYFAPATAYILYGGFIILSAE